MTRYLPRHIRRPNLTPRMTQALALVEAAPNGITRAEIESALGLKADNARDILQALRLLGKIDSTGGKWSKWFVANERPGDPTDAIDLPNPRQIIRPAGTWKAAVKQPNSWCPQ